MRHRPGRFLLQPRPPPSRVVLHRVHRQRRPARPPECSALPSRPGHAWCRRPGNSKCGPGGRPVPSGHSAARTPNRAGTTGATGRSSRPAAQTAPCSPAFARRRRPLASTRNRLLAVNLIAWSWWRRFGLGLWTLSEAIRRGRDRRLCAPRPLGTGSGARLRPARSHGGDRGSGVRRFRLRADRVQRARPTPPPTRHLPPTVTPARLVNRLTGDSSRGLRRRSRLARHDSRATRCGPARRSPARSAVPR
jgi:hypothetical protein